MQLALNAKVLLSVETELRHGEDLLIMKETDIMGIVEKK
jgi:hypothetical protein